MGKEVEVEVGRRGTGGSGDRTKRRMEQRQKHMYALFEGPGRSQYSLKLIRWVENLRRCGEATEEEGMGRGSRGKKLIKRGVDVDLSS